MKRNIRHIFAAFIAAVAFVSFVSCESGSEKQAQQAQLDSLTTLLVKQTQDLQFYQECISLFTEGMDSIAKVDNTLLALSTNSEGTVTRESIKQDLDTYASMLARQRERIGNLESQLNSANEERAQLQNLLSYLNEQIGKKDVIIQELQDAVEEKNFRIENLNDRVNRLMNMVSEQQERIETQSKTIDVAVGMLNEVYYIVGTSKELKEAGVLAGKFLAKSKVDVNNMDFSLFTKADKRKFNRLSVPGGKIKLKTSHKDSSYRIDYDKNSDTSTLIILDEMDFWSSQPYCIIQK